MKGNSSVSKKYRIVAVADTVGDGIIQQSLELIEFAGKYTGGDNSLVLLAVPGRNVANICVSLSEKYGIDTAALEHEKFYLPDPELLSVIVAAVIEEYQPEIVVFTHTMRNCQSVSKISVLLKASSVTAVESFRKSGEGCIFQRSIFNGKLKMNTKSQGDLQILTVLPGAYSNGADKASYKENPQFIHKRYTGCAEFIRTRSAGDDSTDAEKCGASAGYEPLSISSESEGNVKLEDADVIVSAGRGIGKEENLELVRETSAIFPNSAVGASRPICDNRWLPFNQQVGVTGKTVMPKLYIACGISGSQQHIAGMKNSQCIVAINKDPNAAIFSVADYCVVEDITTFLPLLVKTWREKFKK